MMLIIPAPPSPSYFAVGLVMTSTLLTCSAGIICKASAAEPEKKVDSLPLTKNLMLEDPLRLTLPSKSTESSGVLRNTSVASSSPSFKSFSAL